MDVERGPLPGDLQSTYREDTEKIIIDPAKVPPHGEADVIAQTVLLAAGRSDLAPFASRGDAPEPRRHLRAVPDPPELPAIVGDDDPERVDGVG